MHLTLTTKLQQPPFPNTTLTLPTSFNPAPASNPALFNDALSIRLPVFNSEQNFSADAEIDADDSRSWQWIIYHSRSGSHSKYSTMSSNQIPHSQIKPRGGEEAQEEEIPIGVIRLVPPPHPPHELLLHPELEAEGKLPKYDLKHEAYVRLTRLAVLSAYRGLGLGRVLIETLLEWATQNAREIDRVCARVIREGGEGMKVEPWRGLVLVHAQTQAEGIYSRMGFETDDGLGKWDEEGVEHVGMWRRVSIG